MSMYLEFWFICKTRRVFRSVFPFRKDKIIRPVIRLVEVVFSYSNSFTKGWSRQERVDLLYTVINPVKQCSPSLSKMTVNHPSPVPTVIYRMLRVLSEVISY